MASLDSRFQTSVFEAGNIRHDESPHHVCILAISDCGLGISFEQIGEVHQVGDKTWLKYRSVTKPFCKSGLIVEAARGAWQVSGHNVFDSLLRKIGPCKINLE
jgi:hypothetical protein